MSAMAVAMSRTERTYAYAILAKLASNMAALVFRMLELCSNLEGLLSALHTVPLEVLAPNVELRERLQEVHELLLQLLKPEPDVLSKIPPFGLLTSRLRNNTEDLGEILENLILLNNSEFHKLVAECTEHLSLSSSEGSRVRHVRVVF